MKGHLGEGVRAGYVRLEWQPSRLRCVTLNVCLVTLRAGEMTGEGGWRRGERGPKGLHDDTQNVKLTSRSRWCPGVRQTARKCREVANQSDPLPLPRRMFRLVTSVLNAFCRIISKYFVEAKLVTKNYDLSTGIEVLFKVFIQWFSLTMSVRCSLVT